jgi:uncharacterized protein with GYD domain
MRADARENLRRTIVAATLLCSDVLLALLIWWLASALTLGAWDGGAVSELDAAAMVVVIGTWVSPEGLTTLKRNPSRLQEVNQEVEQFGARVVQQYALLGAYDFITVLDAPDSETVARISVELGSRRTASYETLTAIPVDEFISSLRG